MSVGHTKRYGCGTYLKIWLRATVKDVVVATLKDMVEPTVKDGCGWGLK
jgi:hypothetical protein